MYGPIISNPTINYTTPGENYCPDIFISLSVPVDNYILFIFFKSGLG